MKKQAFNPYLPFWETVPDGEPHVFGGRLYVFGSHDQLGGDSFCPGDYVCWSAPVEDLADWRYEGVIYRKEQDPLNWHRERPRSLYAPDVAQGPDGRYYLYYALEGADVISVAVCDSPAGKYEFLDHVRYRDGSLPKDGIPFDPAILCEPSGNYLYYGFGPPERAAGTGEKPVPGAVMVRLADDMHTILTKPVLIANGCETAAGTSFEQHPFFEASSIRRFGGLYYFVYSSLRVHELCLATAASPEGPFTFRGVIISNGDIGFQGNTLPTNYTGNNHGGLVEVEGRHYIFWHRHTHGNCYSRQGCAQEVRIEADGNISQVEITSCGLNGGPLSARGTYGSYIACHLTEADRTRMGDVLFWPSKDQKRPVPEHWPFITEEQSGAHGWKPYIHNMQKGTTAGFKYFLFDGSEGKLGVEARGCGQVAVRLDGSDGQKIGHLAFAESEWAWRYTVFGNVTGVHGLHFVVTDGTLDFSAFQIE